MATLTLDTGKKIEISSTDVLRIRRYFPDSDHSNSDGTRPQPMPGRSTRIDCSELDFVQELPAQAALLVTRENDKVVPFTMLDKSPIWINAGKAAGPYHIPKGEFPPKANSALLIGGKVQFVTETPEQVAASIKSKGGTLLPLDRDSAVLEAVLKEIGSWVSEPDIWDAEMYRTPPASGT